MIEIKNIRLASDKYATFSIKNGLLYDFKTHVQLTPPKTSDLNLDDFLDASSCPEKSSIDAKGALIVPTAIDSHVHSRDPGLTHKEDWKTLAEAALKGGVGGVIEMPNTIPPTFTKKEVLEKAELASKTVLNYRFLLGVTEANIRKIKEVVDDQDLPVAGLKIFYGPSTGGQSFSDLHTLDRALGDQNPLIVFHAEDHKIIEKNQKSLTHLLSSSKEKRHYALHSKIRSPEAATSALTEILSFAKETGRRIHIAHVSTPNEIENILASRDKGVNVTAEICPHHLIFSEKDYTEKGPFIVMNPPVRSEEDVKQLRKIFAKGQFSTFATDHAPHTKEEKEKDYPACPSGVPSIEFFYPLLFKSIELSGAATTTAPSFVDMVTATPAELFGFTRIGSFKKGYEASFVWLEEKTFRVTKKDITAKCQWSPYEGTLFSHRVKSVWIKGKRQYVLKS